jgi:hypothetical protein
MSDDRRGRRAEEPAGDPPADEHLADDGPTELVPTEEGELVERLSGGTATVLLVWLIGVGALSALLAAGVLARIFGQQLGAEQLFSDFGFYVGLAGATGPCVLWLAGRAQGHSLGWFVWMAVRIGLLMIGIFIVVVLGAILILGRLPGAGLLLVAAIVVAAVLVLSVIWALAVWSADRYIARARVDA